jgi:hypothetical protein
MATGSLFARAFIVALFWGAFTVAQESQPPSGLNFPRENVEVNPAGPCLQPPIVHWEDYQGKFQKSLGLFARKLVRTPDSTSEDPERQASTGCTCVLCAIHVKLQSQQQR